MTAPVAYFKVLVCILLGASPAFAGHLGSTDLNPRQTTPGLQLELGELPASTAFSSKAYRLRASGYPRDLVFSVFAKNFVGSFDEVASGFHVDNAGNMILSRTTKTQRLEDMVFGPGPYPRGAAWEVAVASVDRSIAAFARVIPYPIIARGGTCVISLELLSHRGDRFLVTGHGFVPGDDVITESRYDGRVEQKRKRISVDGMLPLHVIAHAAIGLDRSARYSVKSPSCELAVDYEWGEPALIRRSK